MPPTYPKSLAELLALYNYTPSTQNADLNNQHYQQAIDKINILTNNKVTNYYKATTTTDTQRNQIDRALANLVIYYINMNEQNARGSLSAQQGAVGITQTFVNYDFVPPVVFNLLTLSGIYEQNRTINLGNNFENNNANIVDRLYGNDYMTKNNLFLNFLTEGGVKAGDNIKVTYDGLGNFGKPQYTINGQKSDPPLWIENAGQLQPKTAQLISALDQKITSVADATLDKDVPNFKQLKATDTTAKQADTQSKANQTELSQVQQRTTTSFFGTVEGSTTQQMTGFKTETQDYQFIIDSNKKLVLRTPPHPKDIATKTYVDTKDAELKTAINKNEALAKANQNTLSSVNSEIDANEKAIKAHESTLNDVKTIANQNVTDIGNVRNLANNNKTRLDNLPTPSGGGSKWQKFNILDPNISGYRSYTTTNQIFGRTMEAFNITKISSDTKNYEIKIYYNFNHDNFNILVNDVFSFIYTNLTGKSSIFVSIPSSKSSYSNSKYGVEMFYLGLNNIRGIPTIYNALFSVMNGASGTYTTFYGDTRIDYPNAAWLFYKEMEGM